MEPQIQPPVLEPVAQKSFITRYEWPAVLLIILFLLLLISFIWWPILKDRESERINAQNNTPIIKEEVIVDWKGILKNTYGVEFEIPENYLVQYSDNLQEPTNQVWHLAISNGSTTDSVIVNISGLEKAYNNETCPPIDYLWPEVKEVVTLASGQKVSICKRIYSDSSVGYSFFIKTKNPVSPIIEVIAYSSPDRSEEALRMLKEMLLTFKFSDLGDISTWKTYKDPDYNLLFKYPEDWKIEGQSNGKVGVKTNPDSSGGINVYKYFYPESMRDLRNPEDLTGFCKIGMRILKDNLLTRTGSLEENPFISSLTSIKVEGKESISGVASEVATIPFFYIQYSNTELLSVVLYSGDDVLRECQDIMNQILSSFKFISTSTPNISTWKTYRNEEYGFEFKYPVTNNPYVTDFEIDTIVNNVDVVFRADIGVDDDGLSSSIAMFSIIKNTSEWLVFGDKKISEKK
jgi:hypothetical protein